METAVVSPSVVNVVATSAIDQGLDLEALVHDLPDANYNPDDFPGIIYRLDNPETAILIFTSGKIVCTGARSSTDARTALNLLFDEFRELGIALPSSPSIEIQNVVSEADFGQPLSLNAIAIGLGLEHIEYEPEQFPGLIYRLDNPRVVALLFGSGKLVVTGGQSENEAEQAVLITRDRLAELGLIE